jgi:hypothetical protein
MTLSEAFDGMGTTDSRCLNPRARSATPSMLDARTAAAICRRHAETFDIETVLKWVETLETEVTE